MPVVTALRATRRGGVALHVDDEFVCTVSEALVARWRLFKGRELDEADVAEIRAASSPSASWATPTACSATAPGAGEELRRRLLAKEHDEHAVEDALERLAADGLLDDAAFARSYVADKRRLGGLGRRAHPPRAARARRRRRRDRRGARRRRRRRRRRGRRARPRPRRPAPPRRAGAAARRGPPARLPDAPAPRLLDICGLRRRAALGRRRSRPARIDSARRRHVLSMSTRRVRVLCVFHSRSCMAIPTALVRR